MPDRLTDSKSPSCGEARAGVTIGLLNVQTHDLRQDLPRMTARPRFGFLSAIIAFAICGCGGDVDSGKRDAKGAGAEAGHQPAEGDANRGADDLTGYWNGYGTERYRSKTVRYRLEFQLEQEGSRVDGTSRVERVEEPQYFAEKTIEGEVRDGRFVCRDKKIIAKSNAPGMHWKTYTLEYRVASIRGATLLRNVATGPHGSKARFWLLRGKVDQSLERPAKNKDAPRQWVVFCGRNASIGSPGHAFVVWIREDDKIQQTVVEAFGFYPNDGTGAFGAVEGDLRDEGLGALVNCTHRLKVEVDARQFARSRRAIDRYKTADYSLWSRNCISFSAQVARDAGLKQVPVRTKTTFPSDWMTELIRRNSFAER